MSHEPNASAASPAPADWGDLLAHVRAGDDDAARAVVEGLHGHVRKIVLAHLPRREEPEDLMQEAFLRMFDRLDQYRGAVAFENWVARITVHVCIDRLRRQRVRPEWRWADLSEEQQALVEATAATEADPGPSAPENARELLDQLLASLKPEEQMILRWFDLEQKTIAEVCALTGWNSGVVRIRVFRARRKLRALYRKLEHSKP
jgi:RNA polymerase sigma-70 factor (ECF subfamily)